MAARRDVRQDALVLENMGLAESIARRFGRDTSFEGEDLVQVAYVGLVKAASRYDAARGIPFRAFAVPTITGELRQHLRDHGWIIRPPRPVRDLYRRVAEATPRLTQHLGHGPTPREVAAELREPVSSVREATAWRRIAVPYSLDARTGPGDDTLAAHLPAAESAIERAERILWLQQALRSLPARESRVLRLRYVDGLTQECIASRIGLSQMQVSRILRHSLDVLRDELADRPAALAA